MNFTIFLFVSVQSFPCPFNEKECDCSFSSPPSPNVFSDVDCYALASLLPNFIAPPGITYSVHATFRINNAIEIQANHFAAFDYIHDLELSNKDAVSQKWDDFVFENCSISQLSVSNLNGIIPPPVALNRLGKSGLKVLTVSPGKMPVYLSDYVFVNFTSLSSLQIGAVPILQIDEFAFVGLEETLTELSLAANALKEFPSVAINRLKNLTSLNLANNGLTTLPEKAFSAFTELKSLSLSANDLEDAINNGALDYLPSKLTYLQLLSVGLHSVPKRMLVNLPQLEYLMLRENFIAAIRRDDFQDSRDSTDLIGIDLSLNPISTLDNGAFAISNASNLAIQLSGTNLTSVDLFTFTGSQSRLQLMLSDIAELKYLTASIPVKISHYVGIII